jgi:DNA-binding NarL/FixJ family response regulator
VAGFAAMVGVAVEGAVLRGRVAELSAELRHLAASAQGLAREVVDAPVAIPFDRGFGVAFAPSGALPAFTSPSTQKVLTAREMEVAALVSQGRSNRQIAEELTLATDTVKSHVARIMRKLQASNRAEAAAQYLRLTSEAP